MFKEISIKQQNQNRKNLFNYEIMETQHRFLKMDKSTLHIPQFTTNQIKFIKVNKKALSAGESSRFSELLLC